MQYLPNPASPVSKSTARIAAAVAAVLLAGGVARGANTTYTLPNASALNWETAAWTLAGGNSLGPFPNAAGDIAQYLGAASASTVLDRSGGGPITIGKLVVGGPGNWTIVAGTSSGFIFDNTGGTGNASISATSSGTLTIAPNILLQNSNLDLSTGSNTAGVITISSAISGAGGVTKTGLGNTILSGSTSNTYTGDTTVVGGAFVGQLSLQKTGGAIAVPGDLIMDGAISGNSAGIGTAANTVRNQFGQQFGANSVIRFVNNTASTHAYFSLYGNDQTVAGISESVANGGIIQNSQTEPFAIDSTLTINNSGDFSFAGYLRDNSNTGTGRLGLIKTGAGRQTLSGDKISYSGPTTINAGTLELVNASLFKSSVTFGLGSTGTLQIGSGALTVAGLATADALNNSAIVQAGTTANATLTVAQPSDSTFGGVLRDNGVRTLSLVKTGTGTLTLAGNNTHTGTTTLGGGKLSLGSTGALGTSGQIIFNGGGLQYTAANTTDYSARFSSAAGQAMRIDTNGQIITLASNLTSSSGTLTKEGAGTLILSGANTYAGITTINEGILQAGSNGAIAGSAVLTFAPTAPAGTTFRLNGFNVSVGTNLNSGLSSASTGAVIENGSAANATFTVLSGSSNAYAGILRDGGAGKLGFTRGGGGTTLTFTGANTYTGITTLNTGTLAVSLLANGGQASGIGASDANAGNLVLNGGVLSYVGSGAASTNRLFTLGATGGLEASGATATDTVAFTNTGAFSFLAGGARTFSLSGSNTGNNTFAGIIADGTGATSLSKTGAGQWILTNNQTYTGATTVSGGRLIINGSLAATAVTAAGGAIGGTGSIGTAGGSTGVTLAGGSGADTRGVIDLTDGALGTLTIRGAAGTNGLTIGDTLGNSAGLIFEIGSGGASDIIAIATAKLLVNSGGARVDIAGLSGFGLGTYQLLTFDADQASGLNNLYLGTTAGGGYSYSLVQSANAVQLLVSAAAASAMWNVNASGNWFTADNWSGGIPNGTGASATLGSIATAARTVTLDQSATVGSLTFANTNAYTIAASGGSGLTLNNNGAGANVTVTSGSHSISAPIFLTEATNVAVNGTQLSISGIVAGNGRLTKTGAGTLSLTGLNTFGGGVTIRGGTLQIATEKQLGVLPATFTADNIVLDGGILRSTGLVTIEPTRGMALTANGGTIRAEGGNFTVQGVISDQAPGAGALTIAGGSLYVTNAQSTYTGGTILTGTAVPQASSTGPAGAPTSGPFGVGTLTLAAGSKMRATSAIDITLANNVNITGDMAFIAVGTNDKNLTFTGGVTLSGGTRTLTISPSTPGHSILFLGAINDGGNNYGLIKEDAGNLVFGGANTFTGGLTINAGTVTAQGNAAALGGAGTGIVRLGNTTGSSAATLLVGDALTYANPITVQAGSSGLTTIGNATASASVLSGPITLNKALTLAGNSTGSLTLSGAITGTAALRITGSTGNFVQLAGNNAAYTGNIAVESGTLRLGAANAINVANTATVSSAATLELNGFDATLAGLTDGTGGGIVNNAAATVNTLTLGGAGTFAYSGKVTATIPANLALTKTGSGTQTLSGLSTYTGATTVNGGTLALDLTTNTTGVLAAASKLTLGGGTLSILGATTGASAQTLGDLTLTANTTSRIVIDSRGGSGTALTLGSNWSRGAGGNALLVDLSSGNATLTSNPSSLLANGILNFVVVKDATGTGFGTITGGNIVRAAGDALTSTSNDATKNYITKVGDAAYGGGTTLTMAAGTHATNSLTIDTSGGSGTLALGTSALTLASNTLLVTGANDFSLTGGTLGASASTVTINQAGTGNLSISSVISGGGGGLIKLGGGTITLTGTNTYTGATVINEGTLAVSGGNAISNASTVTLADAASAVFRLNASESIASLSGGGSTGGSVDLGSSTLTLAATTGSTTFSGVISGAGAVIKTGAGFQYLGGANTYSGLTTAGALGMLRITNGSALGSTAAGTVVVNGGRLEMAGGITVSGESLTISGSGGNNQGALQSSVGTNTWTGTVTLGESDTRLGASLGATLVISGAITDGPNSYRLAIRTADGVDNTVVLSGVSDYNGGTDIVVGTLKIADGDNRLPTDTIVRMGNVNNVSDSRFDLNGWNQQIGGLANVGTLRMVVTSATAATLTIANAGSYSFAGTITGAVGVTKAGLGNTTQTLTGANTYSGATTVNAGVLAAGAVNTFSNTSAVSLANVATARLDLANFNQTIGSLAGGGTTGGNVTLGTATLTTGRDNKSTAYAGVISGANGSVVKEGTGTMALNGVNTYTGTTTVKAGTMIVGGTISGSLATVGDVANGVAVAVLMGGSGTVSATPEFAGISAVTAGARVDPGTAPNTAGVLNAGTFSLTNSAHLSLQIGGATVGGNSTLGYDRINVTGVASASLGSGSIDLLDITTGVGAIAPSSILFLVVNNGAGAASTLPASITLNGALIGDLSNIVISGLQFSLVNDANFDGVTGLSGGSASGGNDLALVAVPEPGSWLALITGTSLVAGLSRFRRRRA